MGVNRLIIDVSSLGWTALFDGKDKEFGYEVQFNDRTVNVNSAQHGYENAVNFLLHAMDRFNVAPSDMIFVNEGESPKAFRRQFLPEYSIRDNRAPEQFEEFFKLKDMLFDAFTKIGASIVTQDNVEADDIIAYLVQNLDGHKYILSNDGDMTVLINETTHLLANNKFDENKYGPFDVKYVTVYKALVGDPGDKIPGAKGFGDKAFLDLLVKYDEDGLAAMEDLILKKDLGRLSEDVADFKALQKIIDNADTVYRSYAAAKLYPDRVNTLRKPLVWTVGMVKPDKETTDERLKKYAGQVRLVTASNYNQFIDFFKLQLEASPQVTLDLETTVPVESEDWLAQRTKTGGGVDVLASTIVGCGLTFGANGQFSVYISVNHKDTDNCSLDQLRTALELIPCLTIAHNAAGFELPVLFNAFGKAWVNNGWRGFFPNMVDSRIAASYWDENQPSHGLKQLSALLLGYEQTSYDVVTTINDVKYKMDELSANHVFDYGIDDVICTQALYKFFRIQLELEQTYEDFLSNEQLPMYLAAKSFIEGVPIDIGRLRELSKKDAATKQELEAKLHQYLIDKQWEGTVCPTFPKVFSFSEGPKVDDLTPAEIKQIYNIVTAKTLDTQVRTISKLITFMEKEAEEPMIAGLLAASNFEAINKLVHSKFDGKPSFDVSSPKQLTHLLYDVMGLPIRLRNKPTDAMRAKGIREGSPRTDDDAIGMAIRMNDASEADTEILKAIQELKSIGTRTGLYWDSYPNHLHWQDMKLHPEMVQCATNTRRHAGRNPNLQQMDSDPNGVRSTILAHHKDAVLVSLDESAQEIRLLGQLSGDINIRAAYDKHDPKDLHSFTAAMIQGVSYDEFMLRRKSDDAEIAAKANEARQIGKICFFASSYGAMAPKIAETLGIETSQAQKYLDALDRAFPQVGKWKASVEKLAESQGWVRILGGGIRHLRNQLLSSNGYEAQKALRQASNASIQAAGGNQIRRVMRRIWESNLLNTYDMRFYFPVHDELVISVHKDQAHEVIPIVHGFMCEKFLADLDSESSIGIGLNYGQLTEIGTVADVDLIKRTIDNIF